MNPILSKYHTKLVVSYLKYHLFYDEFDFDSGDTKLRIVRIRNERSRETNRDQPHNGHGRGKIYFY